MSRTTAFDEALEGRSGAGAVRRVARDPLRHGVAELLDDCLPDHRSWTLRLLRTKFKPARKLTAYYQFAPVASHTANGEGSHHVAVSWSADSRVTVLVSPADPAMPQLRRLTQPGYVGALLEGLTGRSGESVEPMSLATIRYRPGQRHVLVARPLVGHGVYIKTDRDDSGARAVRVAESLSPMFARQSSPALVAEPIGYSAVDSAALWREAQGEPLSRLLIRRTKDGRAAVERVGRALRLLHDGAPASGNAAPEGGSKQAQGEAASTIRACEHIAVLLPQVGRTCEALLSEAVDGLDRLPSEPATFGHGDFKCDNLLVHDGRLRILDLDRSGWADPAVDLGKFLADLRWWCPTGEADRLSGTLRDGYGSCDPARWARARLFAAIFELKLAGRRCRVHDLRWAAEVEARVSGAEAVLRAASGP